MPKDFSIAQGASLGSIAEGIVAIFDGGLNHLAELRATAGRLDATAGEMLLLLDGAEEGSDEDETKAPLDRFIPVAEHIRDQTETIAQALSDESFATNLKRLTETLSRMDRRAMELRSICYVTKIVAQQTGDAGKLISAFVKTLDDESEALRSMARSASADLASVAGEASEASATLTRMSAVFRKMLGEAERDGKALATLQAAHTDFVAKTRSQTTRLVGDVSTAIGRLTPCMQFPDAFAQRAWHVDSIFEGREKTEKADERAIITHIAHAQVQSMASALETTGEQAIDALSAVLESLPRSEAGIAGETPTDLWIAASLSGSERMQVVVADGGRALEAALSILTDLAGRIDRTIHRLEASRELNHQLENAACNATIAAAQFGDTGSPLNVIATSVKAVTDSNTVMTRDLNKGLEAIAEVARALDSVGLRDELQKLGAIQKGAGRRAEGDKERSGRFKGLARDLDHLVRMIGDEARSAKAAFGTASTQADPLRTAFPLEQAELDRDLAAGMDLDWIASLYTTEDERALHRSLTGATCVGAVAATVEQGGETDDLDDFML